MDNYTTIYLAGFVLLALSTATVEFCRRDKAHFTTEKKFLFNGITEIHSLASNIGATFSVTYFLGAVIIYTRTVSAWSMVAVAASCAIAYRLYSILLHEIHDNLDAETLTSQEGNLLAEFIKRKFGESRASSILNIYLIIYLGLLTEELAVARAAVYSIIPGKPVVASVVLIVICFVVLCYVYIGGFRAVLVSDFVQVLILSIFLAMLVYLSLPVYISGKAMSPPMPSSVLVIMFNVFSTILLGTCWFLAGLDFSARFNFRHNEKAPTSILKRRTSLLRMSLLATAVSLGIGILFGHTTNTFMPGELPPKDYLAALSRFFMNDSPRFFGIVFLVGIYCMIFTTLDTLIITGLQASHYTKVALVRRDTIARFLLVAVAISFLIRIEYLYVFGIYVASLMILPALAILGIISRGILGWLPRSPEYLWASLVSTFLIFVISCNRLRTLFEYQFTLPGIVLGVTLLCASIQILAQKHLRKRGGDA